MANTPDELIREAFAALLRGDLAERDRLCALATNAINARERVAKGEPLMLGDPIVLPKK